MSASTTFDTDSAQEWIDAHGGPRGFAIAWILGDIADEIRVPFRESAKQLGIGTWLAAIDSPSARNHYTRLIETANSLAEGQPGGSEWTQLVLQADPAIVLDTFRQRLTALLERLNITPPAGNEVEECRAALHALAGPEALEYFRSLGATLTEIRATPTDPITRLATIDFPELTSQEASGAFTHSLSYREFLVRQLVRVASERKWHIADGSAELLLARWTDDDMAQLVDALDEPTRLRSLSGVDGTAVQEALAADPKAGTVMQPLTHLAPESLSRFSHRPDQWLALRERLKRFPVLPELLSWVGLDRELDQDWLDCISQRVRTGYTGRFRELLRDCLAQIAESRNTTVSRWPNDREWKQIVERAVVRESLRQPAGRETEWMRWFRETALADAALDVDRLAALELPEGRFQRTAGFDEYKNGVLALTETQVHDAQQIWEW